MQPKPGKRPLMSVRRPRMIRRIRMIVRARSRRLILRMILIRHIGKGLLSIPDHPRGIVEIWFCRRQVSRNADTPVLIQHNRRSHAGGIKNRFRCRRSVWRYWPSMSTGAQQFLDRRRWWSRMRLLGNQIGPRDEDQSSHSIRHQCQCKDRSAQVSSRKPVLTTLIQTDRTSKRTALLAQVRFEVGADEDSDPPASTLRL